MLRERNSVNRLNGGVISQFDCLFQVRGSIPFIWEQIVDLTYKPKFEIVRPEEAVSIFILFTVLLAVQSYPLGTLSL